MENNDEKRNISKNIFKNKKTIIGIACITIVAGTIIGVVVNKEKSFTQTTVDVENVEQKENNASDLKSENNKNETLPIKDDENENLPIKDDKKEDLIIEKEEFSFKIPNSWANSYKIEEIKNEFGKEYIVKNIVNNKEVISFKIAVNTQYAFGESSWGTVGTYKDKKVYVANMYICRENDGNVYNDNDYKHAREVEEVLKTISVKNNSQYDYLTLSTEEFQLRIPKAWDNKVVLYYAQYNNDIDKMKISQDASARYYKMDIINHGELTSTNDTTVNTFVVMITSSDMYNDSSWVPIGKYNNKNVLVMKTFVCRDNDGKTYSDGDYKLENEIDKIIKTIVVNDKKDNLVIEKEEFSFKIPNSWANSYKIEEVTNKFGKEYIVKNIVNNKEVISFKIAVNTQYAFGESSWGTVGTYKDKKVYVANMYICRENDGNVYNDNDYKHAREVEEVIETISIKNNSQYDYLTLSTEEFQLRIPKAWDNKAVLYYAQYNNDIDKMKISQDASAEYYKMDIINHGELTSTNDITVNTFVVMITSSDMYNDSSWVPIGKYNNKNVLVMKTFVCRDNDGKTYSDEDYKIENAIDRVIKTIVVNNN